MATVATTLRIGPTDNGRTMSLEEFLEAEVDEGYRYELARGVLEVTLVPKERHGVIVWILLSAVRDYQREHPGVIYRAGGGSDYQFCLPAMISGRNPDVAVTLRNTPRNWRGHRVASLAFEVVSKGSEAHDRDYITKRAEYLAYGLWEYWIVDPETETVTVLVRDGDAWVEQVYRENQQAPSLVLPGFMIRVADLWIEADDDQSEPEA